MLSDVASTRAVRNALRESFDANSCFPLLPSDAPPIAGAAYFVAGLGMTALTSGDETPVVVPIRSGLGLRLGYNVGYLKFTTAPTWNPF